MIRADWGGRSRVYLRMRDIMGRHMSYCVLSFSAKEIVIDVSLRRESQKRNRGSHWHHKRNNVGNSYF